MINPQSIQAPLSGPENPHRPTQNGPLPTLSVDSLCPLGGVRESPYHTPRDPFLWEGGEEDEDGPTVGGLLR